MTSEVIEKGDLAEMPDGSLAEVLSIVWPKAWVRSNERLVLVPLGELAKIRVSIEMKMPVTVEFNVRRQRWLAYPAGLDELIDCAGTSRDKCAPGVGLTPNSAVAELLHMLEVTRRACKEGDGNRQRTCKVGDLSWAGRPVGVGTSPDIAFEGLVEATGDVRSGGPGPDGGDEAEGQGRRPDQLHHER